MIVPTIGIVQQMVQCLRRFGGLKRYQLVDDAGTKELLYDSSKMAPFVAVWDEQGVHLALKEDIVCDVVVRPT